MEQGFACLHGVQSRRQRSGADASRSGWQLGTVVGFLGSSLEGDRQQTSGKDSFSGRGRAHVASKIILRFQPVVGGETMNYVCVHGHFYQPPRENPWLETVEFQDSAYPYHDWNERVTAECYAPNAAARILDADNRIVRIVNNYEKISFTLALRFFRGCRRRLRGCTK